MIGPGGTFHHEAVLRRRPGGVWRGRAEPARIDVGHPGMAGRRPLVDLCGDRVTLRRSESIFARLNEHYQRWGQPASRVSFAVGPVVSAVVEDGDLLRVTRAGTGDFIVTLTRGQRCLVALGAIVGQLGPTILLEEDPSPERREGWLAARLLDAPGTNFVWLDSSDSEIERQVDAMVEHRGKRLVVAIAGPDPQTRMRLNRQVAERSRRLFASMSFFDVPEHFATRDAWLASVHRPIPSGADALIRFTMAGKVVELRPGESAWLEPWHLHVARVGQFGGDGRLSSAGMALAHPAVTTEMLVTSSDAVASGHLGTMA